MREQDRIVKNESEELVEQIISSSATVYQENRKPTLFESLRVVAIFVVCSLAGIFAIGYLLGIGWFSARHSLGL